MTQDTPWWQRSVGYQIWPRSFQDSNGDGVGDIPGIISRLDHLADLGIGFLWLSPVYASPQQDMGYDISDYRDIAPEYGTLNDMDRLITEAKARGIGIVMDLVVNHSSDKHRWFEAAKADSGAPERDYYVWRDPGPNGEPPSDLRACFGGPAWNWNEEAGQYYLGYFSPFQPDLNWRNPALRAEIYDMMNWWFDRGIAGFRMDVISLIGKDIENEVFEEGPYLHEYLQEMHQKTLKGRDVLTIGESWSVSRETAPLYCAKDRDELDMVFQFNHIKSQWDEVHGKWKPKPFDLVAFKDELFGWQEALADAGWNSLFLSNHDLPRQVSKYGDDGEYRVRSAKALATLTHLMKGTPFIYQGEEIGMTNIRLERIDQFRDLETIGLWHEERERGTDWDTFLAGANENGRDNTRTPVQWDDGPCAGFTDGMPWIEVNSNFPEINVAAERAKSDGVLAHYRKLVALRKKMDVVALGRFEAVAAEHDKVAAYLRHHDGERLAVVANMTGDEVRFDPPEALHIEGEGLLSTVEPRYRIDGPMTLAPWESFAIHARG
ncbi:alpha-glucosidase [Palleronia abyssalis]|uniref:Oligo-1,6-glucosidase n=1 Tax=Palleronia abyssalis TaxID=1501240 RepID=A0A2R8BYU3_9RHOB|nr:alpha-glucosidase [Palleronia abyssalis]SPJ25283.1 Oligo-1,6-glucosidase [Palleronia abyssalis]